MLVYWFVQERLLELEQKDQENQMMKKYLNKLCEEEAEKIVRKRQDQTVLREELNTYNAEILRRKELAKEQEKIIEQHVIQFQEEKAVSSRFVQCVNFCLRGLVAMDADVVMLGPR